ncbi:MAG: pallilysin-related adhesin [Spirochaetia bacterium]|jgi:hypothetical protein|uniref:Pallilysin beta barrel domain-containing protein n=1 Tax=uncultured spirochete TaxID=156406 RepID=A0A3P3XGF7_9SPIR|nr:pallilysin-related adhesin [Rectinema subterraneum]MDQ7796574.1 pallilysin-related adhesin [Spirochaetia bacterium]SLM10185.1 exported hypothetical protein [uncultured spirochete]HCX96876.1 hypothetical protein [Spirochaetaceae bacterium]
MLKRLYIAAFLVAFALAAWLVALQRQETLQASIPIENRTVMLESSNEKNQVQQQSAVQQRARIAPVPEEIFLKTIDLNLDDDEDFEQVIISRKSTSSQALSIVIAKFSPALGIYFRYFDGEIAATKSDSIIVQPEDVTGDGIVDLVVQGLDASNNQTLTIFRRLSDRGYAKVFSGRGASVVLQENTETEKPRAASIILETREIGSNVLLQSKYIWNNRLSAFEKTSEIALDQKARPIFAGPSGVDVGAFLSWMDRLWTNSDNTAGARFLYLDAKNQELIFSDQQIQQRWIMKSSERNGNRLYITCSTSESSDLDRVVVIEARAENEIAVSVIDQQIATFRRDEGWSSIYRTASMPNAVATEHPKMPQFDFSQLFGRYLGDEGSVLVLSPVKSILVIKGKYREGIARLYEYDGRQVLDFLQIQQNGLASERYFYLISIEQSKDGSVERLHLEPATMSADGVSISYLSPYIFKKTS